MQLQSITINALKIEFPIIRCTCAPISELLSSIVPWPIRKELDPHLQTCWIWIWKKKRGSGSNSTKASRMSKYWIRIQGLDTELTYTFRLKIMVTPDTYHEVVEAFDMFLWDFRQRSPWT